MESIASTTSSTDGTSQVAAVATIGPRPPLPRRTVPLTARPLARELANQGWSDDDNRPVVPRRPIPAPRTPSDEATQVPSPRRSPEQPQPKIPGPRGAYDRELLGSAA